LVHQENVIIKATLEQLLLPLPLLREMQEDRRTLGRVNPAHFFATWRGLLESDTGVMFLSLDGNVADCITSGTLSRDFVTGVKVFQMHTAYAKRGHAKPAMPFVMLRRTERWAREHGARAIFCGAVANDDRGTVGFLERSGYKPSDQAFVKGL
jgi:GNAT superfamily N-acetyltransferase